jgi:hypothetical protein
MSTIIEARNYYHLGDNIINFIFFYKIKEYIETNNIIIHYYCHRQYHNNLLEFKCSDNIKIMNYAEKGHVLWQGATAYQEYIEDTLCLMFNTFLEKHNIPISVTSFEYEDADLFRRYEAFDNIYKNVDILVINSFPLSGQYPGYNKHQWDDFAIKLSKKYKIATSQKVNDDIISLNMMSVKNIAAIATHVKIIIAINTGPSIPLYNKNILDNVEAVYIFGGSNHNTRKFRELSRLEELSFLLE